MSPFTPAVAAFARTRAFAVMARTLASAATGLLVLLTATSPLPAAERLRLIIETDAGGDPDDEQSLVRFLLYTNEWDVEGIIANRPVTREGENLNSERTGLAIVQRQLKAYDACYGKLKQHDPRYPTADELWKRTVPGYDHVDDGVKLIIDVVDRDDPRPVWFLNWGTDTGAAVSCLKRALDRVLAQRGPEGYARFKSKLRLASDDQFGEHTTKIEPPFPLWVDTFRPPLGNKRWYHRFSELTRTAGGFDIERDVRTGHGPLGELYPTNTTHRQKEGDSADLYLPDSHGTQRSGASRLGRLGRPIRSARRASGQALLLGQSAGRLAGKADARQHAHPLGGSDCRTTSRPGWIGASTISKTRTIRRKFVSLASQFATPNRASK